MACTEDALDVVDLEEVRLETLATGFNIPWAIAAITENEFLISDRTGALYYYEKNEISEVKNIPISQTVTGGNLIFGGLMDVSLHPNFNSNNLVYIAYVNLDYLLSVARFELVEKESRNLEVIFKANEFSIGSRIEWEDSEHFFLSLGVGGDPFPDTGPQDLNSDRGKIHRLTSNGNVPMDNPILPGKSSPSSIWSYGHRNPQGLCYDKENKILYSNEHGPLGGDELNIIEKGGNYGWPLFSYGLNYDQTPVSSMSEEEANSISILPIKYWGPNSRVAPSSLLKLSNSLISDWNDSFLIGSLYRQDLIRYDHRSGETRTILNDIGRVRDIELSPDGSILISLDKGSPNESDKGRILRITPIL